MLGQVIKAGTGMCDILLDEEKLIQEMSNINLTMDDFDDVNEHNIDDLLNVDEDEEDEYCNDENFSFSIE